MEIAKNPLGIDSTARNFFVVLEIGLFVLLSLVISAVGAPGVGIVGGALGMICGELGIGAFRLKQGNRCLIMAHFILATAFVCRNWGCCVDEPLTVVYLMQRPAEGVEKAKKQDHAVL